MYVHIRRQGILSLLKEKGEVHVAELAKDLACSEMTVRRDLEVLEELGGLRRVHGGAVSVFLTADEAPFEIRAFDNTEAKRAIGTAVVSMLHEGESVIVDSGSTALEVARSMRDRRLTVMPLALRPAFELDGSAGIKLLLPGGEVRANELSLVGNLAEHAFTQLRFDTFVLGVCAINTEAGVTTHRLAEADVKRAAVKAARRVIAVADASKLGRVAFGYVCELSDIDILVTDESADKDLVRELTTAGIDVRQVSF